MVCTIDLIRVFQLATSPPGRRSKPAFTIFLLDSEKRHLKAEKAHLKAQTKSKTKIIQTCRCYNASGMN
jgi:hypothetical protein